MADILIADDDNVIRSIISEFLLSQGHRVDEVTNGKDAVNLLAARKYELVITDNIMPGEDGLQVLFKAKKSFPSTKVILLCGEERVYAEEYLKMAQSRADLVLEKPIVVIDFLELVDNMLREAA